MYIDDLPRTLPAHGQDLMLRVQIIKAVNYLAKHGDAASRASFSLALQAAQLITNDAALPAAVAPGAAARVLVRSATQLDLVFPSNITFLGLRTILSSQFVVTTGTVASAELIAPNVIRLTGTGFGAGDTTAFTAAGSEATRLRFASWAAVANQAAVGTAADPNLTSTGWTGTVNSVSQITLKSLYRNTGRPAFGQFAVNNGGTVSAVSYPDDFTVVLTGTGYAAGDIVTYTDLGSGSRLNAVAPWDTYTLATGNSPALS